MPKYRKSRRIHKNKKNRNTTAKRKTHRRSRGGGCGCNAQQPQRLIGGSAYLSSVSQYAYYPYNADLRNDPTAPAHIGDARFMGDYSRMSGGGKRSRRSRRRGRKMRGGSNFFSNLYTQLANSGSGMNYIQSFGAANGGINQSALITGTGGVINGAATSQPVSEQPYGFQNPPLA